MKILIDIGHPAHVHYFKNFTKIMLDKANNVLFTCRDKDVTIDLLKFYNFNYVSFGKTYSSLWGKILGLFWFTIRLLFISLKFKPDIILNATFYGAVVARILSKSHISIEDTFNKESTKLFMPFTNVVLTGKYPHPSLGVKEIKYSGYQELLYLHPNYFKPDNSILKELGVFKGEKFFILRFVSWNASHDLGQQGLSIEIKRKILNLLKLYGKVIISSEHQVEGEFDEFCFSLPPEKMHDALAFTDLFIGEGATMASECAMLGTPAIYINPLEAGSIDDQERYGLVSHFRNGDGVIQKIKELLNDNNLKNKCTIARLNMLSDKIDVTAFMVWFIENYPSSYKIMKENPDYQYNFK